MFHGGEGGGGGTRGGIPGACYTVQGSGVGAQVPAVVELKC